MDWTPIWHQAAAPAFAMGFWRARKKNSGVFCDIPGFGRETSGPFLQPLWKETLHHWGTDRVGTGEMHTVTRDGSCVFTVPAGKAAIRMS